MATPWVLVLRAPGANCDEETQFAFQKAGAAAERIHINRLREEPAILHRYQILVIPGGFTYGDDVAAGKILANQLAHFLGETLRRFRDQLSSRGAMFFRQIVEEIHSLDDADVLRALWELVWAGHVTNDTLGPLRALTGAGSRRALKSGRRRPH